MPNEENSSGSSEPFTQRIGPHPIGTAVLGGAFAALLTLAVVSERPRVRPVEIPESPSVPTVEVPLQASRDTQRAAFYDEEVEPEIVRTDALNRQAADRCIVRLRDVINNYRDGVDPFVEDLTSLSTRLGIVKRVPGNWWNGDKRIESYIQEKFEAHLFSRDKLTGDIVGVLEDFKDEVEANQQRMLVNVRASLSTADLPEITIEDYRPFFDKVATQLNTYSTAQGTTSLYSALAILMASEVGSYTAITVVTGLLARFGSAAAATAAVGVGATAGATATGAGGGSFAGPVGTVVGLGVGLAVGLAIDWYMTEQFEAKMGVQMRIYLSSLEETILHGADSDTATGQTVGEVRGGIVEALPVACDRLRDAYRERFYQQIVKVELTK